MNDHKLFEQTLDALSWLEPDCDENPVGFGKWADIMPILRERLAQPEQELVIDCPRCGHCCPQSKESA